MGIAKKIAAWFERQKKKSQETDERLSAWYKTHRIIQRPERRENERRRVFQEMTEKYGGEPLRVRRSMAFDLIRNRRKAARNYQVA